MTDLHDLITKRKESAFEHLFVANTPAVGEGWILGEIGVAVRTPLSSGRERRLLFTAMDRRNTKVQLAFTPEQATALAVAIMRKVNEFREGEDQ